MKITIDNDMMIGTFIISTTDPYIDDLNKTMLSQGYTEHAVYTPTILTAIHDIIAKIATNNGQTFNEVLQFMSETEKEFPAMGTKACDEVKFDYRYFEREKR